MVLATDITEKSLLDEVVSSLHITPTTSIILGGLVALSFLINVLATPRLDPNEPPLLKPSIPLIGHIIGIISRQNEYHLQAQKKYKDVPIATLQMLWGKLYAVWDPQLVQAALRSRVASQEPFVVEFAQKSFGLSAETFAKVTSNPDLVPAFTDAIHNSMNSRNVNEMNTHSLEYISQTLDNIKAGEDGGLEVPNLYLWVRDIITLATGRSLLGKENPFEKDSSLIECLWDFEDDLPNLLTKPFPSITARKGYLARNRLQEVIGNWYTAEYDITDPTVARITSGRARVLRENGFDGREIGQFECMLPVAGSTNTAPTMFWMLCYFFARPALVDKLRAELEPLVRRSRGDHGEELARLDVKILETESPLLVSSYREVLRLINHSIGTRRILQDTTISDGKGRTYLLKKGIDIQISSGVPHRMESVWGDNVLEFDPERFLPESQNASTKAENNAKAKKNAFVPFGGGRHLCPGRYFAYVELIAMISAFLVSLEIAPIGKEFNEIKPQNATFSSAVVKPAGNGDGLGAKITRRKGWENVKWAFES